MVASCWAPGCTNRLKKGSCDVKFFRFPLSHPARLSRWLGQIKRVCGRGQSTTREDGFLEPTQHSRLCSAHFVSGSPSGDRDNIDYVPTLFQYSPKTSKIPSVLKRKMKRHEQHQKFHDKRLRADAAKILLELNKKSFGNTGTGIHCQDDRVGLLELNRQSHINKETGIDCQIYGGLLELDKQSHINKESGINYQTYELLELNKQSYSNTETGVHCHIDRGKLPELNKQSHIKKESGIDCKAYGGELNKQSHSNTETGVYCQTYFELNKQSDSDTGTEISCQTDAVEFESKGAQTDLINITPHDSVIYSQFIKLVNENAALTKELKELKESYKL